MPGLFVKAKYHAWEASQQKGKGWGAGHWYSGTVSCVHPDGSADILYDDGDEELGVLREHVLVDPRDAADAASGVVGPAGSARGGDRQARSSRRAEVRTVARQQTTLERERDEATREVSALRAQVQRLQAELARLRDPDVRCSVAHPAGGACAPSTVHEPTAIAGARDGARSHVADLPGGAAAEAGGAIDDVDALNDFALRMGAEVDALVDVDDDALQRLMSERQQRLESGEGEEDDVDAADADGDEVVASLPVASEAAGQRKRPLERGRTDAGGAAAVRKQTRLAHPCRGSSADDGHRSLLPSTTGRLLSAACGVSGAGGRRRKAPDRLAATADPRKRPPWLRRMLAQGSAGVVKTEAAGSGDACVGGGRMSEASDASCSDEPSDGSDGDSGEEVGDDTIDPMRKAAVHQIQLGARVRVWWTASMKRGEGAAGFEKGTVTQVGIPELCQRGSGLTVRFKVIYDSDTARLGPSAKQFMHVLEEVHVEFLRLPTRSKRRRQRVEGGSALVADAEREGAQVAQLGSAPPSGASETDAKGEAGADEAGSPDDAMRGGSDPRGVSLRADVLAAIRAGNSSRDDIQQHVEQFGRASTRPHALRADITTLLGRELNKPTPLWVKTDSMQFALVDGA